MKKLTPQEVAAWIGSAQLLAGAGLQIAGMIRGWIGQAHPILSADEQQALYEAIMADDLVRAALAKQASRPAGGQ